MFPRKSKLSQRKAPIQKDSVLDEKISGEGNTEVDNDDIVKDVLVGSEDEQNHALLSLAIPLCSDAANFGNETPRRYQSFFAAHYGQQATNPRASSSDEVEAGVFNQDVLQDHIIFVSGFSKQVML